MNKLVIFSTIAALVLIKVQVAQAQGKPSESSLQTSNLTIQFPPGYNVIVKGDKMSDVTGSQYLSEEWEKGRITFNNGSIIDTINLRLNAYNNQMHFLEKGIEYTIGCPDKIKNIHIGNRKFIYAPYMDGESISHGYFEVLVEGNTSLLVLFSVKRIESSYNIALSVGSKEDRLELFERYFLATNSSIVEIDKKGQNLFDSAGNQSDILRKRVKAEKLSFKKKEDLTTIVRYINSIN
jgi:hypothetical protein